MTSALRWLLAGILVATAVFFRFYQLDQIPPGLFPDEATHALDALEVLDGQLTLYSPDEGSTGALWRYLLAIHFALFGAGIESLRIFSAAVGVVSIAMAYLVARELAFFLWADRRQTGSPLLWSDAFALTAALLMAVSYWHVHLSRMGFSAVLMLLVQDAAYFCLWRGFRTHRRMWFWLAGALFGLLMYNYLPGKAAPLLVILFFLGDWLFNRSDSLLSRHRQSLLVAGGLALLIALPLLVFVLLNLQMLFQRAGVPSPGAVMSISPWQSLIANFSAFGLWPDRWLSGQWHSFFLGFWLTAAFATGVLVSLIWLKRPATRFLLLWWLVMLLPAVLAPEGAIPHSRRAIGAATPTFILVSQGLTSAAVLVGWLIRRLLPRQKTVPVLRLVPIILLLTAGGGLAFLEGRSTFHRYFTVWGSSEETRLAFHVYDLQLAEIMARESGPETVYLLPLDSSAGIVNPLLDTITFVYRGQAGYDFLPDDESILPDRLNRLTAGRQIVRLVRWKVTKHTGADPKHVAAYYLEKWGDFVGTTSYPYFDIDTYRLHPSARFDPAPLTPSRISFENQFALTGYAFGTEAPLASLSTRSSLEDAPAFAGGKLWVELEWEKINQQSQDVQVGIWLEDEAGHIIGQTDKKLLNNIYHQGTSAWAAGETGRDYYLLPIDPAALPGPYRLKVILYTNSGGEAGRRLVPRLPGVGADLAVGLDSVLISPPASPLPVDTSSISVPLNTPVSPGLTLLGVNTGWPAPLHPGDRLVAGIWWQKTGALTETARVQLIAVNPDGEPEPLSAVQSLDNPAYPAVRWPTGTVVQTPVMVKIPAELESGQYGVQLRLVANTSSPALPPIALGSIEVAARLHRFSPPEIEHPVAANFDNRIALLGYNLDLSQIQQTGTARLSLYWQASAEMDVAYKVFLHFLDGADNILFQIDREPQAGETPTTGWVRGEIIEDTFDLPADGRLDGVARLAIGFYNPRDGKRLPVRDASGRETGSSVILDSPLP